jgi:hypothetical protein
MPLDNTRSRRAPRAPLHRTILVYSGGLRTERDYLDGFEQRFRTSAVTVRIRADGIAPEALVQAAAEFADFASGVDAAVKRARDLEPTGGDHRRNPSTNMWRLAEQIRGDG